MSSEAIANFDVYAWFAVGLFVAGLFAVMIYERETSKSKRQPQQQTGPAAADAEE
jgi:hypothetical protein